MRWVSATCSHVRHSAQVARITCPVYAKPHAQRAHCFAGDVVARLSVINTPRFTPFRFVCLHTAHKALTPSTLKHKALTPSTLKHKALTRKALTRNTLTRRALTILSLSWTLAMASTAIPSLR